MDTFGKPRRPLVPKFEPLFLSAQSVADAVLHMRKDIGDAEAFCGLLEDLLGQYEINFDAMRIVEASIAKLRSDITDAAQFCAALEQLTGELRAPSVTDDKIEPPRMLTVR